MSDPPTPYGAPPPIRPASVPALRGVRAYQAPAADPAIDLRLDGTERRSLPADVAAKLSAIDAGAVSRYPEPQELEAAIAERHGVQPERVLVTAGADEALDRVCRALLCPGRRCVLATPTFEMLPRYAELVGATIDEVSWPSGPPPIEALGSYVTAETAMVAIVSPNNPTGAVATADEVARLAAVDPAIVVVVDQAYGEFADVDLTGPVAAIPNALTVRTFSKAYGLSGLRVGYAIGPADVIGWMRAAGGPYSVSRPSLLLAATRFADDGDVAAYVACVREERTALEGLLRELGAQPLPSQANFVLCRFTDAEALDAGLAGAGIAVRAFHGRADLDGWRRITCPADAADFERLTTALRAVLEA